MFRRICWKITYYPKFIEFLEFVYECNPNIALSMISIAQISDIKFWDRFINICNKFNNKVMILIPLDGLSDTYSMYRINCSFETAFNNALYLIKHGLRVSWGFIKFPHNIHQLETCRKIAKLSGFYTFDEKDAWNFESDNYHFTTHIGI